MAVSSRLVGTEPMLARPGGLCEDDVRGRYCVTLQVSPRRECHFFVGADGVVARSPERSARIALLVELMRSLFTRISALKLRGPTKRKAGNITCCSERGTKRRAGSIDWANYLRVRHRSARHGM